jgi:hypothetical protein
MMKLPKNKRERMHYLPPSKDRAKLRSLTYEGIANALAEQYTAFVNSGMTVLEWSKLLNGLDILERNTIISKYVHL